MTNHTTKPKPKQDSNFSETKFGSRAISEMNKSRVITLPKVALSNLCGSNDPCRLDVTLVQKGKQKFIKLTLSQCEIGDTK